MTTREKELIAIGVSYAIHCEPCIRYHWQVGKAAGVTREEAQEAVRIAETVAQGAKLWMNDKVEELFGLPVTDDRADVSTGCGCEDSTTEGSPECGC